MLDATSRSLPSHYAMLLINHVIASLRLNCPVRMLLVLCLDRGAARGRLGAGPGVPLVSCPLLATGCASDVQLVVCTYRRFGSFSPVVPHRR